MLSPAVRAAAAQEVTREFGYQPNTPAHCQTVSVWLSAFAQGYRARPERTDFPLAGQREFLRLLAPYVAEGITVYHPFSNRYGLLKGLPFREWHEAGPVADVEWYADAEARAEGCGDSTEPVGKLLPVLYAFEDLATEMLLPDGRRGVPVVELLRIAAIAMPLEESAWAQLGRDSKGSDIRIYAHSGADRSISRLTVVNWKVLPLPAEAFNWLRAAHFATPELEAHQYHRRQPGFDYASGAKPADPCAHKFNCHAEACPGCEVGKEMGRG